MSARAKRVPVLLSAAVVVTVVGVLLETLEHSRASHLVTFAVLVAIAELFDVNRPAGIRSSLGIAPAFAYVLLGHAAPEAAMVYAIGASFALIVRWTGRQQPGFSPLDTVLGAALVLGGGGVYGIVAGMDPFPTIGPLVAPTGVAAAFVFVAAADLAAKAAISAKRTGTSFASVARSAAATLGVLHLTAVSLAGLLALEYPRHGFLSIVLLLGPIAATHFAFGRLESAQRLYVQTIDALSEVPELAGYSLPGHARRVADLAIAVAREMGVDASEIEQTEYAALLHEMGRLALPDPDEDQPAASYAEVAEAGAAIAAETREYPRVSEMIRHQHLPYRRRGMERHRDVPLGSRIIKVACAYDTLRNNERLARNAWEALEHLYLGLTYEYDPEVVQALVRVLERRGEPETGLVFDATRQRNAERIKEDFFSSVSHELRTPLTPIRGYATLLLQRGDKLPEETRREALESIVSGTDRLARLIDDLLLASRIDLEGERGIGADVEPRLTDLEDVVRRAVRPFAVGHPDRTFTIDCPEQILAMADQQLLGQVLGNLLSNAVKFSPGGSPVGIRVDAQGSRARILVRDRGHGIPSDKRDAIFEKFTRLEDPQRMVTGGAGLGLFIVRQLAAAMNGTVTVESQPGDGSTFAIWLPLAGTHAVEAS